MTTRTQDPLAAWVNDCWLAGYALDELAPVLASNKGLTAKDRATATIIYATNELDMRAKRIVAQGAEYDKRRVS